MSSATIRSTPATASAHNRRKHPRLRLSPMYTSIAAREVDADSPSPSPLQGHAYDISEGGVRIELDQPVDVGHALAVDIELPGLGSAVHATGDVVWVNDAHDDPGPRRMAVRFRGFDSADDRRRLLRFLGSNTAKDAA